MDEEQRLVLIAETVAYAPRVRAIGMPAAVYTKALREAIHVVWERRSGKPKHRCVEYRSARLEPGERAIYDHAIPLRLLITDLLAIEFVTPQSVRAVLDTAGPTCLITPEEDAQLRAAGLNSKTPDRSDPLARYKAVGIEVCNVSSSSG